MGACHIGPASDGAASLHLCPVSPCFASDEAEGAGGIAPIASPAVTQKADEEYNEESRSIRERFAAKFSEEIIVSENGYKSPDISVADL